MTPEQRQERDKLAAEYRAIKYQLVFLGLAVTHPNTATKKEHEAWREAFGKFFHDMADWGAKVEEFYKNIHPYS